MKNFLYAILSIVLLAGPQLVSAQAGQPTTGIGKVYQSANQSGLSSSPIYSIIAITMYWLLAILGFIAIVGFVIAGLLYLTAAGDEGQIDRAKEATKYSIIGIIVALIGFVVIRAADNLLNARFF